MPGANIIYNKACELNDEYATIHHLQDFNDGKGVKVEFWNTERSPFNGEAASAGEAITPTKTAYYNEINFSTFGAWGFAEGVSDKNLSVRIRQRVSATKISVSASVVSTHRPLLVK